jgi:Bacterial Ig-like domain (group 3)
MDMCRALRRAAVCIAIGVVLCCADTAYAAPSMSFTPAFSESAHLGEPATLTTKLTFSGTEYFGHPEPLTALTLKLPAGTILSSEGFPTCSSQILEEKGAAGCTPGSDAGPLGSFTVFVRFGTETLEEHGFISTVFAPGGGLFLYGKAFPPTLIEFLSYGVFEPASAPFGPAVKFNLPIIDTVPSAPSASFTSLTVGLGGSSELGHEVRGVTVPAECLKGALSWRADATFNDESGLHEMTAHAEAETACPSAGTRVGTTTSLVASNTAPVSGEPVTYTAKVAPKIPSLSTPSGVVTFLDGGAALAGCEAVTVVPGESSSTATCHTTPETGVHTVTAVYQGDSNFLQSEAPAVTVTVTSGSGEEAKKHEEEEAAAKKHAEEEAAAKKHAEEEATAKKHAEEVAKRKGEEEAKRRVEEEASRPVYGVRAAGRLVSGTVLIREGGRFVSLPASGVVPVGSELDATNGRVVITVATATGGTQSAEVYGGRFKVTQDRSGETHFVLSLPLTGCPRVALPGGSAAAYVAKRRSGPTARHLWVSENGGRWGTNGRYVSTSVEGTTWLTLDECTRSEVKVTAGKVKVRDLLRKTSKTIMAGKSYIARAGGRHH